MPSRCRKQQFCPGSTSNITVRPNMLRYSTTSFYSPRRYSRTHKSRSRKLMKKQHNGLALSSKLPGLVFDIVWITSSSLTSTLDPQGFPIGHLAFYLSLKLYTTKLYTTGGPHAQCTMSWQHLNLRRTNNKCWQATFLLSPSRPLNKQ